jgi:5-methylthioadenosine/S-adenosylhomocysteine deaminase
MLARGINVVVGTDSCASSPDLDIVDDLRLVRSIAPEIPAPELWEMVTSRAAKALSMDAQIGTLAAGKRADWVSFQSRGDDPLETILQRAGELPNLVWMDGRSVRPA